MATLGQSKMTPVEAGAKLLRHADAIRMIVGALDAGHVSGPKRTRAGYRRFAPHFDRVLHGRNDKPYTMAWLCQNIGSQYSRGQATPWITGALQLLVNLERGAWSQADIERVGRGEHGYTAHALCLQFQKESRKRMKYVRRQTKKRAKPVKRKALGFGHAAF
jgi:hypothetical protein